MFEGISLIGVLAPLFKKSVENAATKYIEGRALKGVESLGKDKKPELVQAVGDAYGEWLTAVILSLNMDGWDESQIQEFFPDYMESIECFLQDEEVAGELMKPFHSAGSNIAIDANLLLTRWTTLNLRELPENFDAFDVGKSYLKRLEKARIVKPEFRDLFVAQHVATQTGLLEGIRGAWPDFDLDGYATRVKTRYRVLDLSALTPPERDDQEQLKLRDVFIAADVRESRPPREVPKGIWAQAQGEAVLEEFPGEEEFNRLHLEWTQKVREPILDVLGREDNRLLVILGDPGSGKSTLARYLLLSLVESSQPIPSWLEVFKGHLPLLVELRDYMGACEEGCCQGVLEYFHYLGKTQGYALNHVELKERLKDRPSVLIFDGLDEIFESSTREQIIQEIIGVARDYPQARIVVTSRIVGYNGQALQAADFREYTLQDLNPAQVEVFSRGWFSLIYAQQPDEARFRVERILRATQNSSAIRQLAGNPLLLTMIAIIAKHQELPRERVKLYEHAARVLCHHWDVTGHKIPRDEIPAEFMLEGHKLELLCRLARKMQSAPKGLAGNFISGEDLRCEIESYLQQRWQLPPRESAPLSAAILAQLRERNFILCLSGPNIYSFVHRTFLEYFSAKEIVERFEKTQSLSFDELRDGVFLKYCREPAWHEVLRLISGMIATRFAENLILSLLLLESPAEGSATPDLILATQCFSEISDVHEAPDAADRVLKAICRWFDSGDRQDWKYFSYEKRILEDAVPAIESVGRQWPGREKIAEWLLDGNKKVSTWDGVAAFGRVTAALWADLSDTWERLIQLSEKLNGDIVVMAFDALVRCYGERARTFLCEKVFRGPRTISKRTVLLILTRHYQDQPETFQLVCAATGDDSEEVRGTAIQELSSRYTDHPDAFQLLRAALEDAGKHVRRIALSQLSRHYKEQPETLPLLRSTAKHHLDSETRSQAAIHLMRDFNDKDFVLPLVLEFSHDANVNTRRNSVETIVAMGKNRSWAMLLSLGSDYGPSWLDPQEPIDNERVRKVAASLRITRNDVRKEYEVIARNLPLRLKWRRNPGKK